jgi:hypothetical protein
MICSAEINEGDFKAVDWVCSLEGSSGRYRSPCWPQDTMDIIRIREKPFIKKNFDNIFGNNF